MGPSPRVRGKDWTKSIPTHNSGTIPACAGQSHTCCSRRCRPRDHPRVCGAKIITRLAAELPQGPSPRVRGKATKAICSAVAAGTIPACAGQSPVGIFAGTALGDHPRVCGAKSSSLRSNLMTWGPSPRVRGKGIVWLSRCPKNGTIPACAGQRR